MPLPKSEELYELIVALDKYPGTNEERKALISVIKLAHKSENPDAVSGIALMAYLKIRGTYYTSAKKKTFLGYKLHGSEVEDVLRNHLKINSWTDEDYIIALSQAYSELTQNRHAYSYLISTSQPNTKSSWFSTTPSSFWKSFTELE